MEGSVDETAKAVSNLAVDSSSSDPAAGEETISKSARKKELKMKQKEEKKRRKEEEKRQKEAERAATKASSQSQKPAADDEDMDPTQYLENRKRFLEIQKKEGKNPYPHKFFVSTSIIEYIANYGGLGNGDHLEDISVSLAEHFVFLTWYQSLNPMALIGSNQQSSNTSITSFTFTNPIKLDRANYTIWKQQVLSSIRGNGLEGYIDGSRICPSQFLSPEARSEGSSSSSIEDILSLVVSSKTSFELWKNLEKQFGSESMAKKVHLKMLLSNLRKGSLTMSEYFTKLKSVTDGLALAGSPVHDLDLITHLITGLDQSYYPVVVYIEANMLKMDLSEAYAMLLTHEARLENNKLHDSKETKNNYAANVAQAGNFSKKGNNNNQNNWKAGGNNWNNNSGGRGGFGGNGRGGYQGFNSGRGNWNNNNFRGAAGGFNSGFPGPGGFNNNYGRGGFNSGGAGKNFAQGNGAACQICFRFNHTAADCRDRFNRNFIPNFPAPAPNHFSNQYQGPRAAFITTSEGAADQGWFLDSGATHHLTNTVQNLSDGKIYFGSNLLTVGNGQGLRITHIGSTQLHTPFGTCLQLQNILCVPQITKNLISISKLLTDNDITIEFFSDVCFLKDKVKGTLLAQGIARDGLYKLLSKEESLSSSTLVLPVSHLSSMMSTLSCNNVVTSVQSSNNDFCFKSTFPVSFQTSSSMSANMLHNRLGHPSKHVIQTILRNNCLMSANVSKSNFIFCDACQLGKLHQLHFPATEIKTKYPLELIHTDLWGPAPVLSLDGYRYYISFVDDFTRYCWIFPLVLKSDALTTFKHFKSLVEKQFNLHIKTLQSDMGGEFKAFQSFLQKEGIQARFSCPYTHHQNGVVERKHRHLVETGLTLLAQAKMHISFWWEAFHTASYLINRMPTTTLNNLSPYQKLHNQPPNYQLLRVFGCACYPFLRPYNDHKLDFHSQKCLFLGYSPLHKGYRCLTKSGKVYVVAHIVFNESDFPYSELFSSSESSSNSLSSYSLSVCILNDSGLHQSSATSLASAELPTSHSPQHAHQASHLPCPSPISNSYNSTSSHSSSHNALANPSDELQPSSQPVISTHQMVTRAKSGIFKPKTYLTATQDLEPVSVKAALIDTKWKMAMQEEYNALQKNGTWTLVPAETATQLVGNNLAVMQCWPVRQLDVNNAFLNGMLTEDVFMPQPEGFINSQFPTHVCKLQKALYGLKQAPRAWYDRLKGSLVQWGFRSSKSDTSLFFKHIGSNVLIILVYVDDILITGSSEVYISEVISLLSSEFALKDLGDFNYFLGVEVTPSAEGLHLSQTKYVGDILRKAHMLESKGCNTPISVADKLQKDKGCSFPNPSLYRSIIGSLQYLTLTRPDIAFTVNKLSQFLAAPTSLHWQACKRVLRYLQSTAHFGLQFFKSGSPSLIAYSDADWGSDPDDRRSVGGYCVYLGSNLVSWSSKKQNIVSRSSAESEYRALALATSEVLWITYLLKELKVSLPKPPVLYCDNSSAEALASNPKYHSRTKHIELDLHFVREHIANKDLFIEHVSSSDQLADVLTKPLSFDHFAYMRTKLNVCPRP
ncbi:retrovirus-related pol polyprotein from transposon RE1 [Citrus sinensis]|uniref:Retrovirus-related pol polyprotein from transposon RE1 n=1 Tax=Citrus sinensis TaxID=2711 RepID=A0ACB8P5W8_CITSI|nr:retrovirus-related pol polyprotein from transposon RE1 [Citrus sinensis]